MDDYYKTKDSVKEYIQAAEGFNGKSLIDKFAVFANENTIVLELGSGPGTDWQILNKSYEVVGSDFSEEFINHLKATYPKGEFVQLDASTLEIDKEFDVIYSNKVLHHLTDKQLINSIKRQYKLLKKNGLVCHSYWKGNGSEVFKGLFVNYHTKEELELLFKDNFEILHFETYEEFEENDSILLIGRKK
ncbi:class I SAM-dependent methyltransferase [Flavobacteriales bacterium]|nr:class I SAM-dependent methyltransferase [Flavobacteriales bacterium]